MSNPIKLSSSTKEKYLPPDLLQLAQRWVILLKLSRVLGRILSKNYRPIGPMPTSAWVKAMEKEAVDCMVELSDLDVDCGRLTTLYTYHCEFIMSISL